MIKYILEQYSKLLKIVMIDEDNHDEEILPFCMYEFSIIYMGILNYVLMHIDYSCVFYYF